MRFSHLCKNSFKYYFLTTPKKVADLMQYCYQNLFCSKYCIFTYIQLFLVVVNIAVIILNSHSCRIINIFLVFHLHYKQKEVMLIVSQYIINVWARTDQPFVSHRIFILSEPYYGLNLGLSTHSNMLYYTDQSSFALLH